MSFAQDTKAALCALEQKRECCELSMLYGLLRFGGSFSDGQIAVQTKNAAVTALTARLLHRFFGTGFSAGKALSDADSARLRAAYHFTGGEDSLGALPLVFHCQSCRGAFLRGVFLAAGNLSAPDSAYHLDLTVANAPLADELDGFLCTCGLAPKRVTRKGLPVLYYKESAAIEDFLAFVGANKAAFMMMDAKIRKDIRNNINRINNSEVANMKRVAGAANPQLAAIRGLIGTDRLSLLPSELQYTARLRFENPEASLGELALLHVPPLTKSGLNHRLQRIVAFAAQQ